MSTSSRSLLLALSIVCHAMFSVSCAEESRGPNIHEKAFGLSGFVVSGANSKTYTLLSQQATAAVGTSTLQVRGQQPDLTGTSINPPLLQSFTPSSTYALFKARLNGVATKSMAVQDQGERWTATSASESASMDKVSGAWSYTNNVRAGSGIGAINSSQEAVDIGLRQLAARGLLALSVGETVDILRVRRVMGAMYDKATRKVVHVIYANRPAAKSHVVEYVVNFGRRLSGVPVIGSKIDVRLSPEGKLLGVDMLWRPIKGKDPTPLALQDTTSNFSKRLDQAAVAAGRPVPTTIVSRACGLVEAPARRAQTTLLPGCEVRYRAKGYAYDQIVYVPLSTSTTPLLGSKL